MLVFSQLIEASKGRMDFLTGLNTWYEENKRDLPWRRTRDPYRVWLSEVILQQTRVEQGRAYYERFLEEFPTVQDLASASLEKVMLIWQGLGYYNRARNLHHTARYIAEKRGGRFPEAYEGLLQLKGVGEYTAAAIASFCFQEPKPVLDGNVKRVLARLFGIQERIDTHAAIKRIREKAETMIDSRDPATFNQAIMEFGALHCKPAAPFCSSCPFREECVAYRENMVETLPRKGKKRGIRDRFFNYLVIRDDEGVFLQKRGESDIWKGLYEFPLIETRKKTGAKKLQEEVDFLTITGGEGRIMSAPVEITHQLSHQRILARFWEVRLGRIHPGRPEVFRVPYKDIGKYALPRLLEKYMEKSPAFG